MQVRSRGLRRVGRSSATLVASFTLVVSACSSSDGGATTDGGGEMPEVQAVSARPDGAWGMGRAVLVRPTADGTAIATTAGLFVVDQPGAPPREIAAFERPTRATAMEIVDDTTMMVAFDTAVVVRYDIASGSETARLELPVDRSVLGIEPGSDGAAIVETTAGPVLWASPADASGTALVQGPTGSGATTVEGAFVVPLAGTDELAVVGAQVNDRVSVSIPAEAALLDAQVSPNGEIVAVTAGIGSNPIDREDQVELLDAATLAPIGRIETGRALDPAMWTVTDSAVVAADGGSISVWSPEGVAFTVSPTSGIDAPVTELLGTADGVVSIHDDGSVMLWSGDAWESTRLAPGDVTIYDAVVSSDGQAVTTVDFFGGITTWDLVRGESATDDRFGVGRATGVAATMSGDQIAASFDSGRIVVLDAALSEEAWIGRGDEAVRIDTVRFEPTADTLVTARAERTGPLSFDDTVTVLAGLDGSARFSIGGESEEVAGCSSFNARIGFAPDGSFMAVASHDFSVSIVDLETGAVDRHLPTESGTVLDLAYTSDGRYLVVTTEGSRTRAWDTSDYSVAADVVTPMGGYQAIAMLPDAATMATVELTGTVSLVDVLSGEVRATFPEPADRTQTIAVSDDGALVAAPGPDATVSIWSARSGQLLASVDGATGTVIDLSFAPGGRLVAASDDGTVRTWGVARRG